MQQVVTYNALVGYEIEKMRKEAGFDQAHLAQQAGISQPVLSRLEKGKASITIDQLFVICKALGQKPQNVLERVERNVIAINNEESVQITTSKEVENTGGILAGAALGAIIALLLSKK